MAGKMETKAGNEGRGKGDREKRVAQKPPAQTESWMRPRPRRAEQNKGLGKAEGEVGHRSRRPREQNYNSQHPWNKHSPYYEGKCP